MIKKFIRNSILKLRGEIFSEEYSEIKNINNEKGLQDFNEKYLKKLLLHAYNNVPYYHDIFEKIGLLENGEVNLNKFKELPLLTKDIIKKEGNRLISADYEKRKWCYNSSGGSTGVPTRFIQDSSYYKWGDAVFYYWYKDIVGIDEPNVKKVILWGSEKDLFKHGLGTKAKIINWLTNTIFLNSFRMTEKDIDRYIEVVNSYKPDLIRGYAGSLYELCQYIEKKDKFIYSPKVVISAAEVLSKEKREKIEKIFKVKVYDFYGSRETSDLAGECVKGLMHVFSPYNYVEILNDNNEFVGEGEEGRVIVTNLHNYSMPFIRYEIGDMAVLGPKVCECGNIFPVLKKITGRITDHFIKRDKTVIHGEYFTHLFYFKDWVRVFQIVQEDYEKIRISVVLNGGINESEKTDINNKIKLVMGDNIEIFWDFVEKIPTTESGKYLYTKSLISRKSI